MAYLSDINDLYSGDIEGGLHGNVNGLLLGNVIGGVHGSINGLLVGEVAGGLHGDLAGQLTGDLSGGLHGNLDGNMNGDLSGGVHGHLNGNMTGVLTGDIGGCLRGTVGGRIGDAEHPDQTFIGQQSMEDGEPHDVLADLVKGDVHAVVCGNLTGRVEGSVYEIRGDIGEKALITGDVTILHGTNYGEVCGVIREKRS